MKKHLLATVAGLSVIVGAHAQTVGTVGLSNDGGELRYAVSYNYDKTLTFTVINAASLFGKDGYNGGGVIDMGKEAGMHDINAMQQWTTTATFEPNETVNWNWFFRITGGVCQKAATFTVPEQTVDNPRWACVFGKPDLEPHSMSIPYQFVQCGKPKEAVAPTTYDLWIDILWPGGLEKPDLAAYRVNQQSGVYVIPDVLPANSNLPYYPKGTVDGVNMINNDQPFSMTTPQEANALTFAVEYGETTSTQTSITVPYRFVPSDPDADLSGYTFSFWLDAEGAPNPENRLSTQQGVYVVENLEPGKGYNLWQKASVKDNRGGSLTVEKTETVVLRLSTLEATRELGVNVSDVTFNSARIAVSAELPEGETFARLSLVKLDGPEMDAVEDITDASMPEFVLSNLKASNFYKFKVVLTTLSGKTYEAETSFTTTADTRQKPQVVYNADSAEFLYTSDAPETSAVLNFTVTLTNADNVEIDYLRFAAANGPGTANPDFDGQYAKWDYNNDILFGDATIKAQGSGVYNVTMPITKMRRNVQNVFYMKSQVVLESGVAYESGGFATWSVNPADLGSKVETVDPIKDIVVNGFERTSATSGKLNVTVSLIDGAATEAITLYHVYVVRAPGEGESGDVLLGTVNLPLNGAFPQTVDVELGGLNESAETIVYAKAFAMEGGKEFFHHVASEFACSTADVVSAAPVIRLTHETLVEGTHIVSDRPRYNSTEADLNLNFRIDNFDDVDLQSLEVLALGTGRGVDTPAERQITIGDVTYFIFGSTEVTEIAAQTGVTVEMSGLANDYHHFVALHNDVWVAFQAVDKAGNTYVTLANTEAFKVDATTERINKFYDSLVDKDNIVGGYILPWGDRVDEKTVVAVNEKLAALNDPNNFSVWNKRQGSDNITPLDPTVKWTATPLHNGRIRFDVLFHCPEHGNSLPENCYLAVHQDDGNGNMSTQVLTTSYFCEDVDFGLYSLDDLLSEARSRAAAPTTVTGRRYQFEIQSQAANADKDMKFIFNYQLPDGAHTTSYALAVPVLDDTTAIEQVDVAADNAEAVYYNLQGIRVENPAQGTIVIRVRGDKTDKILVK